MAHLYHTIDFSRFIAIGDSITAGYADGALYYSGQVNAYPNLIARQYQSLRPLVFRQPLVAEDSPGIGFIGRSRLVLVADEAYPKNKWGRLANYSSSGDTGILSENTYHTSGPFHNLSVPGAKAAHLLMPGYGDPSRGAGNFNPFFTRMASDPVATSVLQDILKGDPTFFTLLIGNNDILSYAMQGGTDDTITPVEGPVGKGFSATFRYTVDMLTAKGAKGILATLPDLTSIPFFNTILYDDLLLEKKEAEQLTLHYAESGFRFKTGTNAFVIEAMSDARPALRQMTKGDIVLCEIMQDEQCMEYLSGQRPIPKRYYLTAEEVYVIKQMIGIYNEVIAAVAEEKGLGVVSLNKLLANARPDRYYDARARAIHYMETGAFSLDGIHINAMGQALLANEFIRVLYRTYGLRIPRVPIVQFRKKHRVSMQIK